MMTTLLKRPTGVDYPTITITDSTTPYRRPARHLHLNRPHRRNSLSPVELRGITKAFAEAPDRFILFTAEPPAFCAGLDLKHLAAAPDITQAITESVYLLASLYKQINTHPMPTLAVVDGPAAGGGVGLVACFDRVIATYKSRFTVPSGPLEPLAQLVIPALELRRIYLTDPELTLSAQEAFEAGLTDNLSLTSPSLPSLLAASDTLFGSTSHARSIATNRRPIDPSGMKQRVASALRPQSIKQVEAAMRSQFERHPD